MYPWPTGDFDNVMDVALDIAMNYLDLTGQAVMYEEVRSTAAMAITDAWKIGVRHRIRLAHIAIKVVEHKQESFLKYQKVAAQRGTGRQQSRQRRWYAQAATLIIKRWQRMSVIRGGPDSSGASRNRRD
jgi:hypothetical protein